MRNKIYFFFIISILFFSSFSVARAATYVVDRADDVNATACTAAANDCTLRGAINASLSSSGADTINFAIPGTGVHIININSPLPTINDSVIINGATQTGYFGLPLIELNGTNAGAGADGLSFVGNSSFTRTYSVFALAINRFSGNGINLNGAGAKTTDLTLLGNFIGTNAAGTADLGNGGNGIRLKTTEAGDYAIGGTGIFEGNIVSGNGSNGILIIAPDGDGLPNFIVPNITVRGNFIGTNFNGNADLGNDGDGIETDYDASSNGEMTTLVGGTTTNARNLISGNNQNGILLSAGTMIIEGNRIGINDAGTGALGNTQNGVRTTIGGGGTIGGTLPGAGNVISGNNQNGVLVNSHSITIQGNRIGTNNAGTVAIPNIQNGIQVFDTSDVIIGSETDAAGGNLISGNGSDGITFDQVKNSKVYQNKIGTNLAATGVLPNQQDGVDLFYDVPFGIANIPNEIGKNIIAGNLAHGIRLAGEDTRFNKVEGNFIGTNASGANLGNGMNGIYITLKALENIIGGVTPDAPNVIVFNDGDGISMDSGTKNALQRNSIYSNGGLGIDLGISGVTQNDTDDADTGANGLQNFPVLQFVATNLITGTLNSTANTNFTIDFYRVDSCDASGNGEGRYFLGSANTSTPADGTNAGFNVTTIPLTAGQIITATATDATGNTSEFSQCKTVTPPPGNLTFSVAGYTANENAGTRTIIVSRNGGSFGTITVDYATGDGTATAGLDYTANSGTLTFLNGEVIKTFDVAVTNDSLDETDETVNLTLSNASLGVSLTPNPTAVLTILDNDNPPTVSINDVSMSEGNLGTKQFAFNVQLSAPSALPISVDYATSNGTATASFDYAAVGGQVEFAPGETLKNVQVTIIGEITPELDETFFVNLSNPTNAALADNQGLGTILDDDNPGKFSFSFAPYSGTEHDTVTVTVSRTNGTAGTVSVDYATSGGTAAPFTDYTPVAGTLIFGDGETTKTFAVSLTDDATPEPSETVNLVLSNPIGGAILGAPSVAVLNIFDNDGGTLLTLAGEVRLADNTPLANVTLNLQGTQSSTTTTDAGGRYSFPNLAPNGNYSVTPSALGYIFSPVSQQFNNLTTDNFSVNFTAAAAPSRQLRIIGGNAAPGQNIAANIELVAQGDENSLGFSLNYDQTILTNPNAVLGLDASGAFLTVNASQSGKLGILLALPAGQSFTAGTKQIVTITFNTLTTNAYSSPVTFGNAPIAKQTANTNADPLSTVYLDGAVTFAQGFEADVAPRPTGSGNGTVTIADFTQVGRFVAGLDMMNPNFNEFQRADSAPRISLGNGSLTVADYTQAGRYAAGLDPVNPTGGQYAPNLFDFDETGKLPIGSLLSKGAAQNAVPTVVRVVNTQTSPGQQVVVSIAADAQGTENGFGFSINYDQTKLSSPLVAKGADTQTATLIPNISTTGKIGVVLAMPFGQAIAAGNRQIVTITFNVLPDASGSSTPLIFADVPTVREISDVDANVLQSTFQDGSINILAPTASTVIVGGRVLDADGRGVSRAQVTMTDMNGVARTAVTNPFGLYRFEEVEVGSAYVISVRHKEFQYQNQTVTVVEELNDVNFWPAQ